MQFQISGLAILILLFIFYKSHRPLRLYKEKVFYEAMCTIIISLILDIASLFFINLRDVVPILLVNFVCKTYIISLIWDARVTLSYVLTDLFSQKKHKKVANIMMLVCLIQSAIIYMLPIHIYDENGAVYTYGAADNIVYVFSILYILTTIAVIIILYKRLNPRRAFAVILWMIIWIISAGMQFLNHELLIVGFASAMGVLILFVIMENPEANLDRELGCFNSYAMARYITQLMQSKQEFSVLELTFEHSDVFKEAKCSVDYVMRQILHKVKPYKDVLVFKKRNIGFIFVCVQKQRLEAVGNEISTFLSNMDSVHEGVTLILSNQTDSFESMDNLLDFLSYVRSEHADKRGQLFCVNDSIVEKYTEQQLIEEEIENALKEDRVEVFLQPIYSNHKKRFTSAEALVLSWWQRG